MLEKFWRAIRTPSLTRRLMLSQLALMVAIWSVLVVLIIRPWGLLGRPETN